MDIKMRKMLVSMNSLIGPDELKTMTFFCKELIPTRVREEIETAVDLFEKLEERGKLKPDDLSFLEVLLESTCAGRTDLIEILHNYKKNNREMDIKMRKMLVSMNSLIGPDELKTMTFFCKELIPTRVREEIETAVDLFEKLEERGKLKPDDLSFLEVLLESTCAGRTDLIEILHNYKKNNRSYTAIKNEDGTKETGEDLLRPVFFFLAKNLGREYLMVLRRLGIPDAILDQIREENPRNVQMVIHEALKYWHQSEADSACKEHIVQALRAERRNDLALRLMNGDI